MGFHGRKVMGGSAPGREDKLHERWRNRMKLLISKDWVTKMAEREGDAEIGAGALGRDPEPSAGPELEDWAKHPHGQTRADPTPETALIVRLWDALESYAVHHANCYGEKACSCGLKKLMHERNQKTA